MSMAGQQHETERKRRKIIMKKFFILLFFLLHFTSTSTLDVDSYHSIALLDVCTISFFHFEIGQFRHCSTSFISRIVRSTGRWRQQNRIRMIRMTFKSNWILFFCFWSPVIRTNNIDLHVYHCWWKNSWSYYHWSCHRNCCTRYAVVKTTRS